MEANDKHKVIASQYFSQYFLDAWGVEADEELKTELVSPKMLLTANRLDLACKLYFIDCLEKKTDMSFARKLYQAHLAAFSGGSFVEPGQNAKNSPQDYYDSFCRLIEDMREHGFDQARSVVPVGENGAILDGAHRVAIAIYYNIPLSIVRIPGQSCRYDYAYFRDKSLPEDYLDFMAYQFIRFSDRVYTVCMWPVADQSAKLAEADQLIRGHAAVVHQKKIPLNYSAVEQLMISFYHSMPWTGSVDNGYCGVASKAKDCFRDKSLTNVYIICDVDLERVLELKQRIRDLYDIDNSSVHITDTHAEAIEAGKLLLFGNSIDLMNARNPFRDADFIKVFSSKEKLFQRCSCPDTTLALYGIGDHCLSDGCGDATDWEDPKDYLYFWGVKLPSLSCVKAIKQQSDSQKSREDVRRIEAFERKRHSGFTVWKEQTGQAIRSFIYCLQRAFRTMRAETVRAAKIFYHRFKYRKIGPGSGKRNVMDLKYVFLNINTTTADYLVMRNWEGFYDDILLEGHNDIDILCRDRDSRDIIVRLLDARPLTPDGFHYSFQYQGRAVTLDTRILGDGYYDRRWQRDMLKTKKLHPQGFYIMNPENYFYSLIYHAIYQKKNGLSDEYAQRLNQMSDADIELTQNEFASRLDEFMRAKHYVYTQTEDQSVTLNFTITPFKKEIRYPFAIRLRHFAQHVKRKHLLQRLKIRIRNLVIRS